jgi:hypothetical protein
MSWPDALRALPLGAERVYTGPGTHDYWRVFTERWTGESDLVAIEQDVLIHDDVLPQFAACPEPWCAFGWQVTPGMVSTCWLGCTKFSAALQREVTLSTHQPGNCVEDPGCGPVPCHRHLDLVLASVAGHLGQDLPHIHEPLITHLRV